MPMCAEANAHPPRSALPDPLICSVRTPAGWSAAAPRSMTSPEPVIDTSADSLAQRSSVMSPEPDTSAARVPTEIPEPSTSPEPVTLSRSAALSNSANVASPLPLTPTASSAGYGHLRAQRNAPQSHLRPQAEVQRIAPYLDPQIVDHVVVDGYLHIVGTGPHGDLPGAGNLDPGESGQGEPFRDQGARAFLTHAAGPRHGCSEHNTNACCDRVQSYHVVPRCPYLMVVPIDLASL